MTRNNFESNVVSKLRVPVDTSREKILVFNELNNVLSFGLSDYSHESPELFLHGINAENYVKLLLVPKERVVTYEKLR
jgi:hypothetical protein